MHHMLEVQQATEEMKQILGQKNAALVTQLVDSNGSKIFVGMFQRKEEEVFAAADKWHDDTQAELAKIEVDCDTEAKKLALKLVGRTVAYIKACVHRDGPAAQLCAETVQIYYEGATAAQRAGR